MPVSSTWIMSVHGDLATDTLRLFEQAEAHHRASRLDAACEAYERLQGTPLAEAAHLNWGHCLCSERRFDDALPHLDQAAGAMHPVIVVEALTLHGHALYALGRADDALARFTRALALEPESRAAAYGAGVVLASTDRHAEALPLLERADPADGAAWLTRGLTLLALDREDEARACLTRVLDLGAPDDAVAAARQALQAREQPAEVDPNEVVPVLGNVLQASAWLPYLMRLSSRIAVVVGPLALACELGPSLAFQLADPAADYDARVVLTPAHVARLEQGLEIAPVAESDPDARGRLVAGLAARALCGLPLPAVPAAERESLIYAALFGLAPPDVVSERDGVRLLRYRGAHPLGDAWVTSGLCARGGGPVCPRVELDGGPPPEFPISGTGCEMLLFCPHDGPVLGSAMQRLLEQGVVAFPGQVIDTGALPGADIAGFLVVPPTTLPHYFPTGDGIAFWSLLLPATAAEIAQAGKDGALAVAQKLFEAGYHDVSPARRSSVIRRGWFG